MKWGWGPSDLLKLVTITQNSNQLLPVSARIVVGETRDSAALLERRDCPRSERRHVSFWWLTCYFQEISLLSANIILLNVHVSRDTKQTIVHLRGCYAEYRLSARACTQVSLNHLLSLLNLPIAKWPIWKCIITTTIRSNLSWTRMSLAASRRSSHIDPKYVNYHSLLAHFLVKLVRLIAHHDWSEPSRGCFL